jgi:deazaflavin-dependent oxidoreductase (nitroreductase family)
LPGRNDYNRSIVEEFRANRGKVGGSFEGAPMVLLTTTGAKSGRAHTTPLLYLDDGDRLVVFASKGGSPNNPDWYYNLLANPIATAEVGDEKFKVESTVTEGDERDRLFTRQARLRPVFGEYQAKIKRRIPVIALRRLEL